MPVGEAITTTVFAGFAGASTYYLLCDEGAVLHTLSKIIQLAAGFSFLIGLGLSHSEDNDALFWYSWVALFGLATVAGGVTKLDEYLTERANRVFEKAYANCDHRWEESSEVNLSEYYVCNKCGGCQSKPALGQR